MHGLPASCKKAKNTIKTKYSLVFLARLLVLLPGGWPRFCFRAVGLMVGLTIGNAVLMALKIAIGLLE